MFFFDHGGVQWLVVFLGNPGLKYQNTPVSYTHL